VGQEGLGGELAELAALEMGPVTTLLGSHFPQWGRAQLKPEIDATVSPDVSGHQAGRCISRPTP